ncbi:hypothetical protein O8C85_08875 [Aliarcobacter butzleri]|uniref:hypothetical protein n=1 Tax=Aliarcobacter butzleri TaxID=28197 RepID=UPI00263D97FB|nr:hypothetical protein [Aliarcobacter butzleri]MDN5098644.1 hypothetical protein [Aliarcobacter butzleri]
MYGRLMNESLKALIENKKALFKALFIPILFLLGINLFFPNIMVIQDGKPVFDENAKQVFMIILVFVFYINIIMAVSVHRIILIKDDISLFKSIFPSEIDFKFFFKGLFLGILVGLVFLVIFFFSKAIFNLFTGQFSLTIALILALLITLLTASRFSMIFPATSINQKMGFLDSLEFTKNYKFLSLFMVVIFPIIISVLIAFVYGLIIKFLSGVVSPHFELLYVFLNVFITVLTISCLSVTYSYIKEENDKKSLEQELVNKEEEN